VGFLQKKLYIFLTKKPLTWLGKVGTMEDRDEGVDRWSFFFLKKEDRPLASASG
jgi:hypothetical protein